MKLRLPKLLFLSFIFLVFIFSVKVTYGAFGVSPPFLINDHLVKGSKYTQVIYLVRDVADDDLPIAAKLDINESVRSWFTVSGGENFTIPKGVRQFPVEVTITVPQDAGLGVYAGKMSFVGRPDTTGQVTIALGVEVSINFTIGEGIYRSSRIQGISFLDIEEGWSPKVSVKFVNEGNIPESLERATYELFDQFGSVRLGFVQKNDGFPEVEAFTTKDFVLDFPIDLHLGIGSYWGAVNFYKDDKVVGSQRTIFNVVEAGSLSGFWARLINHVKSSWIYYVAGLIIAAGVGVFYRKGRRSRR